MYLEHQKNKEPSHGKIPVKKLVGQGAGAKSIEVTDDNLSLIHILFDMINPNASFF